MARPMTVTAKRRPLLAVWPESQPTGRLTFAVFVVAELLCTGALIAWLVL